MDESGEKNHGINSNTTSAISVDEQDGNVNDDNTKVQQSPAKEDVKTTTDSQEGANEEDNIGEHMDTFGEKKLDIIPNTTTVIAADESDGNAKDDTANTQHSSDTKEVTKYTDNREQRNEDKIRSQTCRKHELKSNFLSAKLVDKSDGNVKDEETTTQQSFAKEDVTTHTVSREQPHEEVNVVLHMDAVGGRKREIQSNTTPAMSSDQSDNTKEQQSSDNKYVTESTEMTHSKGPVFTKPQCLIYRENNSEHKSKWKVAQGALNQISGLYGAGKSYMAKTFSWKYKDSRLNQAQLDAKGESLNQTSDEKRGNTNQPDNDGNSHTDSLKQAQLDAKGESLNQTSDEKRGNKNQTDNDGNSHIVKAHSHGSVFDEPQCLINSDDNNKLKVDEDVLGQICGITEQLNVITIAGLYRTGKSYLLTRLAGKNKGFPLGSTVNSKTKGIWAWCVRHPVRKGQTLLLLDTEGLGDVDKCDQNHDNQIFTLATLLSSTLIYNMMGVLNEDALLKLKEIAKNMKMSEKKTELADADFDLYFPEFILALRDFTLDLKDDDNRDITSDEYLENKLKLRTGGGEATKRSNEPKRCMRKYFKKRKCFVFDRPGNKNVLDILDTLQDKDLDDGFVESTNKFLDYVHNKCEPLCLLNGRPVNGRMFASQVTYYVVAIRAGDVPCVESALRSMYLIENERALKKAIETYIQQMNSKLSIPTPDEKTFLDVHFDCKRIAFDVFQKVSVMDKGNKYKMELDVNIDKECSHFAECNQDESATRCNAALEELHMVIAEKLRRGIYTVAGGYRLYRADRVELERKYDAMKNLGVKKQEMYFGYTHDNKNEEEHVLQSDEIVTNRDKENEVSRQNAKLAKERELFFKQHSENENNEMVRARQQLEEEIKSLKEKQTQDMKKMKEHDEEITNKRLTEIQRLEKENMTKLKEEYRADLQRAMDKQDKDIQAMTDHYEYMLNEQSNVQENKTIEFQKRIDKYETEMKGFKEKLTNKESVIGELKEEITNGMRKLETLNRQEREKKEREFEDEIKRVTAEQKRTQTILEEQNREWNRIKEEKPSLMGWIKYKLS